MSGKGGQRRTVACICGWTTKDSVRGANFKLTLHRKLCKETPATTHIPKFDSTMNSAFGINVSKHGNLQKQIKQNNMMSSILLKGEDATICITDVPVKEAREQFWNKQK